jgi:hypothetical protein
MFTVYQPEHAETLDALEGFESLPLPLFRGLFFRRRERDESSPIRSRRIMAMPPFRVGDGGVEWT